MIEKFYGLSAVPFRITPDPGFFYASETHSKALAYLEYGLREEEGFVVLTGEVGTGKSTLIAHLLTRLDQRSLIVAHLATTNLNPRDALRMVVSTLGIRTEAICKADLLAVVENFLAEQQASGRRMLLIVDEAQNLPLETLEELRMLTNLQAAEGRSPLQCFLVGQPQLKETLARPALEQLRQRVIASCHLELLTADETREYIKHRLRIAGWRGRPVIEENVSELIHRASGGVPRRINLLFGRLLLFGAIEEREVLDEAAVEEILLDLKTEGDTTGATAPRSHTEDCRPHDGGNLPHGNELTALAARVEALEQLLIKVAKLTTALLRRETGKEDPDAQG